MLATGAAGALIDASCSARARVVIGSLFTVLASVLLWLSPSYAMVAASQVTTVVAGAALGSALAGITLGMVRQTGFNRQFGRNQVANHADNAIGASLSGFLCCRLSGLEVRLRRGLFPDQPVCPAGCHQRAADSAPIDQRSPRARNEERRRRGRKSRGLQRAAHPSSAADPGRLTGFFPSGQRSAMLPLYGLAVVAPHRAIGPSLPPKPWWSRSWSWW